MSTNDQIGQSSTKTWGALSTRCITEFTDHSWANLSYINIDDYKNEENFLLRLLTREIKLQNDNGRAKILESSVLFQPKLAFVL